MRFDMANMIFKGINKEISPRMSNSETNKITRDCIEKALMILMKNCSFDEITITDICKKAGVSRPAYYRNYKSKEDILNSSIIKIVDDIKNAMFKSGFATDQYNFWLTMFEQIKNHSDTLSTLLRAGLTDEILNGINNFLLENISVATDKSKYVLYFWSGATYNIIREWVRNDMKPQAQKMAREIQLILEQGTFPPLDLIEKS